MVLAVRYTSHTNLPTATEFLATFSVSQIQPFTKTEVSVLRDAQFVWAYRLQTFWTDRQPLSDH